jgi:hypothetical protein
LEQLADELAAAEEDGSEVARPTVDQVWVEPGGRLQLLDFPLSGARPNEEGVRGLVAPSALSDAEDCPLAFVRELATLSLEGRPRADGGRVRAPLPPHASRITDRLFAGDYRTLNQLRADLEECRAHPAAVTAGVRAAHLGAQASMLAFGLAGLFGASGLLSLFVAVIGYFQVQGLQEIRAMIQDPATRGVLLARVRQMPDSRADVREWMERDLSTAEAGGTVRRLDEMIDRQRVEAERRRGHLTRPERALLDRFAQMPTGKPQAADLSIREVEMILRGTRASQARRPEAERWGYLIFFGAVVAVWPLVWAVFAFAFRGGLALSLAGITLVRPDGRKAGRFRCALRELLVWLPITLLLLACMWVQTVLPDQVVLRTALWLTAALLLPVYLMIALRNPSRPPQDRIVGTHLVPV